MIWQPPARFLARVEIDPDGCWLWTPPLTADGYGKFYWGGRTYRAHRWLFQWAHNLTDRQMPPEVCHACDKRACVLETCLFPGTKEDNMRDMMSKGRGRNQFGGAR